MSLCQKLKQFGTSGKSYSIKRINPYLAIFLKVYHLTKPKPDVKSLRKSIELASILQGFAKNMHSVKNFSIDGPGGPIPLRVYIPQEGTALPVVVWFHGGGWIVGNLEAYDKICRLLAYKTGMIVVSVDYRLAPEHPYPAAVEDCWAALKWTAQNAASLGGDPERLAVAGDSAGGNLSAVCALLARDHNLTQLHAQVLIYPCTNLLELNTSSYQKYAKGLMLDKADVEWYRSLYVPKQENWNNPLVSPLKASNFKNLPTAVIITAQNDVLKDEGEAYVKALQTAGVPVVSHCYESMVHGFLNLRLLTNGAADEAIALIAANLKKTFSDKTGSIKTSQQKQV